jgi:hypothetical protein
VTKFPDDTNTIPASLLILVDDTTTCGAADACFLVGEAYADLSHMDRWGCGCLSSLLIYPAYYNRLKSHGDKAASMRKQATEDEIVSSEGLNIHARSAEVEVLRIEVCVTIMATKDEQYLHTTKWGNGNPLSVIVPTLFDRQSE